jgi:hypothetical protein
MLQEPKAAPSFVNRRGAVDASASAAAWSARVILRRKTPSSVMVFSYGLLALSALSRGKVTRAALAKEHLRPIASPLSLIERSVRTAPNANGLSFAELDSRILRRFTSANTRPRLLAIMSTLRDAQT